MICLLLGNHLTHTILNGTIGFRKADLGGWVPLDYSYVEFLMPVYI